MFMRTERILCALLLVSAASAAIAANGDLDPSFGSGGFRLAGISDGSTANIAGFAVQPDGKILLCESEGVSPNEDFFVARFTADGALDTSFSFNGHTAIDFGGNDDACNGLAVQSDGKIVVVGTTLPSGGNLDFAIARLNSDGTLDTSFGVGSGKTVVAFDLGGDNSDVAHSVALRPDGRIVVAGSAQTAANGADFAILQLNTDGSRDTSFNLTGRVTVGFDFAQSTNKNDFATRVALDAQGRIVAAGFANRSPAVGDDMAVIRLLPTGQLDDNFDADGRATVAFDLGGANGRNTDQAANLTLDHEGRIVLVGIADSGTTTTNFDIAVARLLPDGSADATFGSGGKAVVAFDLVPNGLDYGLALLEQSNGKLLVAGTSDKLTTDPTSTELATLVRLNANGTPDSEFGSVGKRVYDFQQSRPSAQVFNGIALQGTQIVLGGALNSVDTSHIDFMVARIQDDLIFANGFE